MMHAEWLIKVAFLQVGLLTVALDSHITWAGQSQECQALKNRSREVGYNQLSPDEQQQLKDCGRIAEAPNRPDRPVIRGGGQKMIGHR